MYVSKALVMDSYLHRSQTLNGKSVWEGGPKEKKQEEHSKTEKVFSKFFFFIHFTVAGEGPPPPPPPWRKRERNPDHRIRVFLLRPALPHTIRQWRLRFPGTEGQFCSLPHFVYFLEIQWSSSVACGNWSLGLKHILKKLYTRFSREVLAQFTILSIWKLYHASWIEKLKLKFNEF